MALADSPRVSRIKDYQAGRSKTKARDTIVSPGPAGHRREGGQDPGGDRRGPDGGCDMAIGPVQLLVLGFNRPDFHGEVIAELERLRESNTVRVIDSIVVYKDADGGLEVEHL